MGLQYRFDILAALKEKGWNTGRLRAENAEARAQNKEATGLSEDTIQRLRKSKPISWKNLENICKKLECQPGDFLVYVPDVRDTIELDQPQTEDIFTQIQRANREIDRKNNAKMIDENN